MFKFDIHVILYARPYYASCLASNDNTFNLFATMHPQHGIFLGQLDNGTNSMLSHPGVHQLSGLENEELQ